jgi:predicted nucleic acid-binding Zn ribbon protein
MWEISKLTLLDNFDCKTENEDIYVVINRRTVNESYKGYCGLRTIIRLDIFSIDNEPLHSFECEHCETLRKNVIKWIAENHYCISPEHSAYIGSEIERAGSVLEYQNYCQR